MMTKVLLLFSGGLDSMLLAERAMNDKRVELHTLFFRYPHPAASREYQAVADWLRRWRVAGRAVNHREVYLPIIAQQLAAGVGVAGARVTPARNLAMVSVAANVAAGIGAEQLWLGACADDAADYPDCRPDWVATVRGLLEPWGVELAAPLVQTTKAEIMAEAKALGLSGWWSCYQPSGLKPCGQCNSCVANAT